MNTRVFRNWPDVPPGLRWLGILLGGALVVIAVTLVHREWVLGRAGDADSGSTRARSHIVHNPVRIGALADKGIERCLDEWSPTAVYLSDTLAPLTFQIIPLGFNEISSAIMDNQIDFIIANPTTFVRLQHEVSLHPLATRLAQKEPISIAMLGAVVFTLSDRDDIKSLLDLQGKTFAAMLE